MAWATLAIQIVIQRLVCIYFEHPVRKSAASPQLAYDRFI